MIIIRQVVEGARTLGVLQRRRTVPNGYVIEMHDDPWPSLASLDAKLTVMYRMRRIRGKLVGELFTPAIREDELPEAPDPKAVLYYKRIHGDRH